MSSWHLRLPLRGGVVLAVVFAWSAGAAAAFARSSPPAAQAAPPQAPPPATQVTPATSRPTARAAPPSLPSPAAQIAAPTSPPDAQASPPAAGQIPPPPTPPPDELDRRQPALAEAESAAKGPFALNGILRTIVQGVASGEVAGQPAGATGYATGSFELAATVRATPKVRLFVDVEGLQGLGPEQSLGTLSGVNSDADLLEDAARNILLQELWIRLALAGGRVRLSVGQLDPTHYFDRNILADDNTTQFLGDAFLNDPMLKAPANGPGATLRMTIHGLRYAFGVHAPDGIAGDYSGLPYLIAEVGQPHHWQWWVRASGIPEDRHHTTWGTGVSLDRVLTPAVGAFLRCGLSRSEGEGMTSGACAGGVQAEPGWFKRARDRLGIGYSYQRERIGSEGLVEGYYTFVVAKWVWVTANAQWVVSGPNQVSGGSNRRTVIPGVRAAVVF